ncbi:MAG: hypothetical protein IJ620_02430, partial [Bacteroidales bacterium]|nr:hypothetical protein [Bacteroidales bacterium]
MAILRHSLLTLLLLLMCLPAEAQILDRNKGSLGSAAIPTQSRTSNVSTSRNGTNSSSTEADTTQEQTAKGIVFNKEIPNEELIDGTYIFHYQPSAVKIDHIEHPTFSAAGLNFFDRLDRIDGNYYLSKGGIGLSHYNIFPTLADGLSWNFQPDINIGYGKSPTSINFFQTRRPFTQLGYASSLNSEYQLKVS